MIWLLLLKYAEIFGVIVDETNLLLLKPFSSRMQIMTEVMKLCHHKCGSAMTVITKNIVVCLGFIKIKNWCDHLN